MTDKTEILSSLETSLNDVRQLPEGSYPTDLYRPDLVALVGISRVNIEKRLGGPDFCLEEISPNDVAYFFFVPKRGMRGGGGLALLIQYDSQTLVTNAKWQTQR